MHLDDLLERVDAHAMEDRVAQDAGVVHDAVELAVGIHRLLDDLAGGNGFRHRFEVGNGGAAALLDFLDDLFGRRRIVAGTVRGAAGIVNDDLGAFRCAQQRDLAADAAARASNDDDFSVE